MVADIFRPILPRGDCSESVGDTKCNKSHQSVPPQKSASKIQLVTIIVVVERYPRGIGLREDMEFATDRAKVRPPRFCPTR